MIIEKLEVGPFAENCYVVGCDTAHEGVVIDPGDELNGILNTIDQLELDIKYILLTHAHLDHVKEVVSLNEHLKAPVFMHKADEFLLENLPAQAAAFGMSISGIPEVDAYIRDGDVIEFGRQKFEVLHTPGHSPGSVTYVSGDTAFVGDVLFAGSIGRTDLPGGSHDVLMNSIKMKLLPLGDQILIYPGHGPATRIGQERKSNPFLLNTI